MIQRIKCWLGFHPKYRTQCMGAKRYFIVENNSDAITLLTELDRLHFLLQAYAGAIRITQDFSVKLYEQNVKPAVPEEAPDESSDIKPVDPVLP